MKSFFTKLFPAKSVPDKEKSCKYLIVPDLHGTYSIFQNVEKFIKSCEEDRIIIFLGDYMDRGESGEVFGREFFDAGSYHTLNGILKLQRWAVKNSRTMHFLRGNHEVFYEDYFLKNRKRAYEQYDFFREGVDALEFAFQNDFALYSRFELFLENLLPYYFDKNNGYLFVHAGIDNSVGTLKEQADNGLIYWIRDRFIYNQEPLPYTVVFGHTPFKEPFIKENKIGLDSGIYKSGFINLLKIDGDGHTLIKL
ncbi:MAG: metallophosphoesterase [Epsilonproteobacteria bacterium]|nr:metallophosphoesterase [Campylobacterota bacterium]